MSDDATKKSDEETANRVDGPAGDPSVPPLPLPDLVEVVPDDE